MIHRILKINELVRKQIVEIISRELNLKPGVFLTVAKVDTSRDLRYTRIFISIFPERETNYVLKTLEKEIYKIQGILNKKLNTHPLPKLEFRVDRTEIKADEIEKILKEI